MPKSPPPTIWDHLVGWVILALVMLSIGLVVVAWTLPRVSLRVPW